MSVTLLLFLIFANLVNSERDNRVITTLKYSKFYVPPTIVNGIPAQRGQVPYLVSIKEPLLRTSRLNNLWINICGGSIISKKIVLTAAHCFEAKDFFYYEHPEILRVVAGNFSTELIHNGNTDTSARSQWRKIKKVVLHSKYYFPENDIALVFVNKPWKFTSNVGYVLTARRKTDDVTHCISVGFASMNYTRDEASPVLLVANTFLLPRHNCSKMWEMDMDRYICTYSFMSDVGRGDSGGPLVCRGTSDPEEKQGREFLVGVVSGRNFDKTTLFTRVSAYKHWIAKNSTNTAIGVSFIVILNLILALL